VAERHARDTPTIIAASFHPEAFNHRPLHGTNFAETMLPSARVTLFVPPSLGAVIDKYRIARIGL
jgi:hypothetical protein